MKYKIRFVDVMFTLIIGTLAVCFALHNSNKNPDMNKISHIESSNNPNTISPKGARGQYQIMRDTWNECIKLMGVDWNYDTYWKDPKKNKAIGKYYLEHRIPSMLKAYNIPVTIETQLACYNGGIGRVKNAYRKDPNNWELYLPQETQEYIKKYTALK